MKVMIKLVCFLLVCCLTCGVILFAMSAETSFASAEGGQIIDKIYVPARTYLIDYQGEKTEFIGSAQYTFVVAVNKNECENLVVDREVYLTHNIGDEFYRSEE